MIDTSVMKGLILLSGTIVDGSLETALNLISCFIERLYTLVITNGDSVPAQYVWH